MNNMNRIKIGIFGVLLSASACGARSQGSGTDSSTHWLDSCTSSSQCGSSFDCICGTCTKACGSDSSCESLEAGEAICAESSCGGKSTSTYTRECKSPDDCPQSMTCSAGACQLRLTCESMDSCSLDAGEAGIGEETSLSEAGVDEFLTSTGNSTLGASSTRGDISSAMDGSVESETLDTLTSATTVTDTVTASVSTTSDSQMGTDGGAPLCPPMRATSSADACGFYTGAAWDGQSCDVILCGCVGADCDEIYETLEQCENLRAACTDTVPSCAEVGLPLVDLDPGFALQHPTYGFGDVIVGSDVVESGPDAGTLTVDGGTSGPFEEWTAAEWRGWLPLPLIPEVCPGIRGDDNAACPVASRLHLGVGGQDVYVDVTYLWAGFDEYYEPSQVEFRIEQGRELEVREAGTMEPILFVGQNDSAGVESWHFARLHARVGTPTCQARNEMCNWLQTASELLVGIEEFGDYPFTLGMSVETALAPYETRIISAEVTDSETGRFEVGHSVSFSGWSAALGDEVCASLSPPRVDGFFIHRLK